MVWTIVIRALFALAAIASAYVVYALWLRRTHRLRLHDSQASPEHALLQPSIVANLIQRRGIPLPAAFVDLHHFDANLDAAIRRARAANKRIRIATKSVRCVALLARAIHALRRAGVCAGLMCYSVIEVQHLAFHDSLVHLNLSYFVAYPVMDPVQLRVYSMLRGSGVNVVLSIDCVQHVTFIDNHCTMPLYALDVDMAWRPLGALVHVGVRRSPLRSVQDVDALLDAMSPDQRARIVGVMGYEAQVAGLGDSNPWTWLLNPIIPWVHRRSMSHVRHLRALIVAHLQSRLKNDGESERNGACDSSSPRRRHSSHVSRRRSHCLVVKSRKRRSHSSASGGGVDADQLTRELMHLRDGRDADKPKLSARHWNGIVPPLSIARATHNHRDQSPAPSSPRSPHSRLRALPPRLPRASAFVARRKVRRQTNLDGYGNMLPDVSGGPTDRTLEFVNGGGSGSFAATCADPSVTEVTLGSGLLQPHLFDYLSDPAAQERKPALAVSLPVTREPAMDRVVVQGGGFIASGAVGHDRQPMVVQPLATEGWGEVQTPLRVQALGSRDHGRPRIGSCVVIRPAKAGEVAERFRVYHLMRGPHDTEVVPTYRGEQLCAH